MKIKPVLVIPLDCLKYIAECLKADDLARAKHKKLDRSEGRRLLEIVEDAAGRRVQWKKNKRPEVCWEVFPYNFPAITNKPRR